MKITEPGHPTFHRLFRPGKLTLGLVLPMTEIRQDETDPLEQLAYATQADRLGFDALWVRDVPLNSPDYPDPVGHLEPWVHLGALAAQTRRVALITGAIVSPLRHPLHVAKASMSLDVLSNGRFVLGLGTGDRPPEFSAFGQSHVKRAASFRARWERIAAALGKDSRIVADIADDIETVDFEMRPRPVHGMVPMLVVGSAQQTLEWIARHAAGWVTYHRPHEIQKGRFDLWRKAVDKHGGGAFRSFSQAFNLQLTEDPGAAATPIELGYRLGRHALVDMLGQHREMGINHVMFNLSAIGRPVTEVMDELAGDVLPLFREE